MKTVTRLSYLSGLTQSNLVDAPIDVTSVTNHSRLVAD